MESRSDHYCMFFLFPLSFFLFFLFSFFLFPFFLFPFFLFFVVFPQSCPPEIRLSRPLFKPNLFQMLSSLWKFKSLRSRKLMKLKLVEKSYYPNISNLNGTFSSFQGQRIKGSVDLHDYLEELKKERNLSLPKDFFFFFSLSDDEI